MRLELKWRSIGHLLEESADLYCEETLFIYEGEKVSFGEVNRRVNRTANVLKSLGVRKGDRVSVMLPNGFDFPISWLAIAKLGSVMVPTNITYKKHDLEYILTDSEASFMIIHQEYLPLLESIRPKVPGLREVLAVGKTSCGYPGYHDITGMSSEEFTIEDVGENDLVNLQYTSGTTGFPKGCMLTHRYWLLFAQIATDYINIGPGDVDLTAQPFYYMDPQWNTALCIASGIPLVIMNRFSPSKFWQNIKEFNVTFFYVLGTMPFYLMKLDENPELEKNHRVRAVICSGIYPEFHGVFEKRWNTPWREAFGMTETGFDLVVPLGDKDSVGSGAMGLPIPTKEVKVVDDDGKDVSDGDVGQLVVRGEPMMLGYWKKPGETTRALKGGWFHTGDLAFRDKQGYFHWVGRIKDMVRRSGENISTTEVEGVLVEYSKVNAVAVIPVPDELRGEEVKAYIVLKEGETPDSAPPEEILEFARKKLAYFKIPRYVEYIDDLPRTPSERVEKHKLIKAKKDLRQGCYDAVEKIWH